MPSPDPSRSRRLRISLICAASRNGVIGKGNRLPWRLPADLKRFKRLTMGHTVIMGRKTFESIGKPLPGRTNVVVTRQKDFQARDCRVAHSLEEALHLCSPDQEVFVIGGGSIFQQALPLADRIYLTSIHHNFTGETHLFDLDKTLWQETSRQDFKPDTENPFPYSFQVLEKQKGSDPFCLKGV